MEHLQAYRAAGGGKHRANKKFGTSVLSRRLLIAAAVVFAASLANTESKAQSGPFAPLAGSWSGAGTVTLDDGSTERIRCRAKYAPIGPTMEMSLTCASDAYKFNLGANVRSEGSAITGSWSEASRNISGSLQGRGGGGNYELVVREGLGVARCCGDADGLGIGRQLRREGQRLGRRSLRICAG